jgi:hypothetical protein
MSTTSLTRLNGVRSRIVSGATPAAVGDDFLMPFTVDISRFRFGTDQGVGVAGRRVLITGAGKDGASARHWPWAPGSMVPPASGPISTVAISTASTWSTGYKPKALTPSRCRLT